MPNVSSVRCVRYGQEAMKIYKASNIGSGNLINYEQIEFENNMRVTSPFTIPINDQLSAIIHKRYGASYIAGYALFLINRRADREYYDLLFCPVPTCATTCKSDIELDTHIAAGLHTLADDETRTTNDIARIHLMEILRSTSTRSCSQAETILQRQNTTAYDSSVSFHYRFFSTCGWALRTRKLGKPMSEKVKSFIEQLWLNSVKTNSRVVVEDIQQQIHTKRDIEGRKCFHTNEYPTKNQIKYQCRKLSRNYNVTLSQQLIVEITEENTDSLQSK